ncbi:MAG: glycerol-3-phosphate acyltransferase [Planctomycetota bacterium]
MLWLSGSFLAGAIPFAVIIGRARGIDLRQHGSGNPGATNLGRAAGKKWGILCFVLDVGKGLLPVLAFALAWKHLLPPGMVVGERGEVYSPTTPLVLSSAWIVFQWVLVAVAAVLGHVFSPFLRFRGGKGVATGLGATLGLFPVVTVPAFLAFVLWYAVCKLTGYVGLASAAAAASLPVFTVLSGLVLGRTPGEIAVFVGLTGILGAFVVARHWGNLTRIRRGTEPKAAWTGKA